MAKKYFQAGNLDRLISVYVLDAINGYGEKLVYSPTPYATDIPAALEEGPAVEDSKDTRETAFSTLSFVVRYNELSEGITPAMKLAFEGSNYDIFSVSQLPEPRRTWIRITAKARD